MTTLDLPTTLAASRPMAPRRAALAGGHAFALEAIEAALAPRGDVDVVAAYRDPSDLVASVTTDAPDIVLIDLNDGAMEGLIAARELRERFDDLRIVLLVDYADPFVVRSALDQRVDALVLKTSSTEQIVGAFQQVMAGHVVLPRGWDLLSAGGGLPGSIEALTPRQRQVLELVAAGRSNAEIATDLIISVNTVKFHLRTIYAQLGVRSRRDLPRILARSRGRRASDPAPQERRELVGAPA